LSIIVAAHVTADEIHDGFLAPHPARSQEPGDIEPEFVAIAPDSAYALVSLQEQSALAVIDLSEASPGARIDVVLLPHGFLDANGRQRGTHPDGLSISADGSLGITANESDRGRPWRRASRQQRGGPRRTLE
jgi:hypothetical protein